MIERYAPSFENHTQVYIDTVSRLSGIGCDEVIDTRSHDHMVPIVAAMSRVENGVDANMSEVEQGGRSICSIRHEDHPQRHHPAKAALPASICSACCGCGTA